MSERYNSPETPDEQAYQEPSEKLTLRHAGKKFEKLLVMYAYRENGATWAVCRCDCGAVKSVRLTNLTGGGIHSCGCSRHQNQAAAITTHGLSRTRLYETWHGMMRRCYDKGSKSYRRYGGRGITVCEAWKDVSAFYEWALTHGYADDLTVERKDNNLGYSPDNVRFATLTEQANNKSSSRLLTYAGETFTMAIWAKKVGLTTSTLHARLRYGWSVGEALTTPLGVPRSG